MVGSLGAAPDLSVINEGQVISSLPSPPETDWNWLTLNKVTWVQNQGSCGAGWAFASIAAIESAHAITSNVYPTKLSEEQILRCSENGAGCNGGSYYAAFDYAIKQPIMPFYNFVYQSIKEEKY